LDDKSKDGLAKDLFPLTSEPAENYTFTLLGQEERDGRSVYHISFRPKDKNDIRLGRARPISTQAEFQPVRVFTKLSRRLPFAVRTLLGPTCPHRLQRGLQAAGGRAVAIAWRESRISARYGR